MCSSGLSVTKSVGRNTVHEDNVFYQTKPLHGSDSLVSITSILKTNGVVIFNLAPSLCASERLLFQRIIISCVLSLLAVYPGTFSKNVAAARSSSAAAGGSRGDFFSWIYNCVRTGCFRSC